MTKCEWDTGKAASYTRKSGVSFDEAGSVVHDRFAVSGLDPDHSMMTHGQSLPAAS
ncbi:MAG: BrnT family toxin [Zetaproteobacteria bacterium]|nr:MAG: BrnT family toxin [Zetaproteobacteria bacterium]